MKRVASSNKYHKAAGHQSASLQPSGDAEEQLSPFPLLSLPIEVLSQHVWPHLGQYMRAQLRAACKELRALADTQLPEHLTVELQLGQTAADAAANKRVTRRAASAAASRAGTSSAAAPSATDAAQSDPGPSAQASHCDAAAHHAVPAASRLLRRSPRTISLTIVIEKAASKPAATASAVKELCDAAEGRLTKVTLIWFDAAAFHPAVLQAVGESCPNLTTLHLRSSRSQRRPNQAAWIAAAKAMPAGLQHLTLSVDWMADDVNYNPPYQGLDAVLGAASQLSSLKSLSVLVHCIDFDAALLAPIASQLTKLELLTFYPAANLPQLLQICGAQLQTLSLVVPSEAQPQLAELLPHTPSVTSLTITQEVMSLSASDITAVAALTGLTKLHLGAEDLYDLAECPSISAGCFSQLTSLSFGPHTLDALALQQVLSKQIVGPQCRLCIVPGADLDLEPFEDAADDMPIPFGDDDPDFEARAEQMALDAAESLAQALERHALQGSLPGAGPLPMACVVHASSYDMAANAATHPDAQRAQRVLRALKGVQLGSDLQTAFLSQIKRHVDMEAPTCWLLDAMAGVEVLAINIMDGDLLLGTSPPVPRFTALARALEHGALPALRQLVIVVNEAAAPADIDAAVSSIPALMAAVAAPAAAAAAAAQGAGGSSSQVPPDASAGTGPGRRQLRVTLYGPKRQLALRQALAWVRARVDVPEAVTLSLVEE